jgi:hypothetical protein
MKLEKINAITYDYKYYLKGLHELDHKYRYEAQQEWQMHWNLEAVDLKDMFSRSLTSKTSARLWGGSKDSAKSVMEKMIDVNAQFIKMAFHDLFDESKDIALRMNRFIFHLDDVRQTIEQRDHRINTHYHDKTMICVYLMLEMPLRYSLWNYPVFEKVMQKVDSRNIPHEAETERYFKSMRALYNVISKDDELIELTKILYASSKLRYMPSLLLVNDWMEFGARMK